MEYKAEMDKFSDDFYREGDEMPELEVHLSSEDEEEIEQLLSAAKDDIVE